MMKYFLSIAGVLILVAGLAAGFVGHFGVMSFAFFAFLGCLITANLDRISEFRASTGGVEAKTREVKLELRTHFLSYSCSPGQWQR